MPEIKHTFAGGRMNKDLDERLVPNGEYKDAMNIQVSTSEGSDVGTAQNILGNSLLPIGGITNSLNLTPEALTVGSIADEKNDKLYWLVWTKHTDYIISYTSGAGTAIVVFRDPNKKTLKFDPRFLITGINIIDEMLFWTDNNSEPKKINIPRSIAGTIGSAATKLVKNGLITNIDVEEKHVTVIKKTPTVPLGIQLQTARDSNLIYTGVTTTNVDYNFTNVSTLEGSNTIDILIDKALDQKGNEIDASTTPSFGPINHSDGLTGWHVDSPNYSDTASGNFTGNISVGTTVVIKPYDSNGTPPGLPVTDYVLKGVIEDHHPGTTATPYIPPTPYVPEVLYQPYQPAIPAQPEQQEVPFEDAIPGFWMQVCGAPLCNPGDPCNNLQIFLTSTNSPDFDYPCEWQNYVPEVPYQPYVPAQPFVPAVPEVLYQPAIPAQAAQPANPAAPDPNTTLIDTIRVKITNIVGTPPLPDFSSGQTELKYVVDLYDETQRLFEFKFPRFSYRYKFEDGEYSPFAPFTQVAFIPGSFDYHPRKGYNLGMTNRLEKVKLGGFIHNDMPEDVVSVDILFKDEPSPNIYIVDTIRPNDNPPIAGGKNIWDRVKGDPLNGILPGHYVIDRETINSVVPSNQLLRPWDNVPRKALAQDITGNRIVYGNYVQNYNLLTTTGKKYITNFVKSWVEFASQTSGATKSIKSLREYQLGVVFTDKYGRETPVISNPSGTLKLEKDRADKNNRIKVRLNNEGDLLDLTHFKFFIKETSGEYYNMAMDRWYDAEDGNIWLAFPSSDRNKIDIDTFLVLKKGSDKDTLVSAAARYKVIAIENNAPDFIKTTKSIICNPEHDSNSADKTLFEDDANKIPRKGVSKFKLNYKPFYGTSGQNLQSINEALYVSFTRSDTSETSKRYRISSITNNWAGLNTNDTSDTNVTQFKNVGGSADAQYSIQVEDAFGEDVNFIGNDPEGTNTNKIEDLAIVNIWKYEVENKPQFDGRFFVKISLDDVLKDEVFSKDDATEFRVTYSKKLYSMRVDHVNLHTTNVDRFLTEGDSINTGPTQITDIVEIVKNKLDLNVATDMAQFASDIPKDFYGYYLDDRFTSFALYFRRYARVHSASLSQPNQGFDVGNILIHLEPGNEYNNGVDKEFEPATYTPVTYLGESWRSRDNGYEFHGKYVSNFGNNQAAFLDGYGGYTSHWKTPEKIATSAGDWSTTYYMTDWHGTVIDETYHTGWGFEDYRRTRYDNPKDTEVWFVDAGPIYIRATAPSYNLPHNDGIDPFHPFEWDVNAYTGTGNIDEHNYGENKGIEVAADGSSWSMHLAYGGIEPGANKWWDSAQKEVGGPSPKEMSAVFPAFQFFNIGNWNPDSGDPVNNSYIGSYVDIVNQFNTGVKFRFREDPTKTVYTIGGAAGGGGAYQSLRHSTGLGHSPYDQSNNIEASAVIPNFSNLHGGDLQKSSMAEFTSFNFTKGWNMTSITPGLQWNPYQKGLIAGGIEIQLAAVAEGLVEGQPTCTGSAIGDDLKIFVQTLEGLSASGERLKLHAGMALSRYTTYGGSEQGLKVSTHLGSSSNEFLVIRHIEDKETYHELWLGGYEKPMKENVEHRLASELNRSPKVSTNYTFVQVGMNGYSDNSEFNVNTMGPISGGGTGKIGAVGYHIDFLEEQESEELLSENPSIWETEPKETKDLDIYYEATGAIPLKITSNNVHDAIPVGTQITYNTKTPNLTNSYTVKGYNEEKIIVSPVWNEYDDVTNPEGDPIDISQVSNPFSSYTAIRPDGLEIMIWIIGLESDMRTITIHPELHNTHFFLPWHNCYSFGNGVESNRIRDNFNLPFIANGVKASTTLETEYKEEHRKYGLIYSGLYNSISGVNNLNQFIAAEKITKDINPIYGSIQKLHSRDADLVTLCEDKCLKILANKDAVFNADGNTNLTATENVLGQTIPFAGEYGISTNPESFASQSYRIYFADKVRGSIMRLSRDGLTPISDHGMREWFKDNLKLTNKLIGSYDDKKDEYNITIKKVGFNIDPGINEIVTPILAEIQTWDGTTILCHACQDGVEVEQTFNVNAGDLYLGCPDGWSVAPNPCGVWGCTDPTAWNYDPLATLNDGSCIPFIYGCLDPMAFNYDFTLDLANIPNIGQAVDDGSCCYISGCMDPTALNYDPSACVPTLDCEYPIDPTGSD
jgi:hypothetical protein